MATTNPSKHTSSSKSSKKRSAHKVHTLPLATMAALLTAATCLGSQPAMAVTANKVTTPTYTATAKSLTKATGVVYQDREYVPLGDKKPWLQHPNILEFRRLRGRNSNATEIKSDDEGSDTNWKAVNDKTAMYAHVETRGDSDYLIFDVFFNNNAKSMISKASKQWYLWQVPYAIADLDSNGLYKSDTVTNLRYDAYRPKKEGHILSQDPEAFEKDDSLSFSVPNMQQTDKHYGKKGYALYQVGIGLNPGNKLNTDLGQIFHKNGNDPLISRMAGDQATYAFNNGQQYNKNYGLGITVAKPYDDVAYHMHAELKLRPGAINKNADNYNDKYANIQNAWTWANSGSWGKTTSSAYTVISGRDPNNDADKDGKLKRNKTDSTAPKIYHNGTEITDKTKPIKLKEGEKLSFTTTDNKGYIEKFSISGLTDTPITKQGAGSKDNPLSSGDITVTKGMNNKTVTITSEDGSGNVTTRKVKVRVKVTTLADEHPLSGKTIDVTVGDKLPELTEIDNFVTGKNGTKLKVQPTLTWNGKPIPNTDTVGVFTHSIKGTYSDNSKSFTNVTINVKPKKPVIDTNLTNLAGKTGQKVTVSVGSGIPTDNKVTTTVKLFDKNGNEIGSTTTIKNGKAEITVNDGIPEGDVYATTTVKKDDETSPKGIKTPGFDLTSEKSDTKQTTKPKDAQDPTITATADSSSVTVGQDLKIHIVAKDDVKVEKINYIDALMGANLLQDTDITGGRASVSKTTDTDQEQVLDLTVTKMQPKEVGTHTITFTVTDSAGKTSNVTLTITVKPKAPTVSVPTEGKDQGSATITPADGTDSLKITYTPEGEDKEKTITVTKGADNKWKKGDDTPEGVTVDETTGKVTIPADKIKDNSDVKAKDSKNGTESNENTGTTGTNPAKPDAPTVSVPTEGKDQGSATITPADGTDSLKITYTPEGEDKEKTITVTKGADNKWKGEGIPDGGKVNENTGEVTIPADKIKDKSDVKAKDSKNGIESEENTGKTGTNPTAPAAPTVTVPASGDDQGSATITPADGTDTLEITYTPEDGTEEKTITVKKGGDGNWTGNTPEGVTVDKATGKVTIPADKVKDNSDVKAKDKKGNTASDETTGKAGNNPTTPEAKPKAPTVTPQDNGSVEVTPADGTDSLEITYTPEGENTTPTNFTVKKENGKWQKGDNTPEGVTVDETTGKVTIPADKIKDNSSVTAIDKKGKTSSDKTTGTTGTNPTTPEAKPAAPKVEPQNDGSVEVTPADGTDSLEITYTPEGENTTPTNFTVKKENGKWQKGDNTPEGVTVDETTGKVTIPADKIKDNSSVTAIDKKGKTSSDKTTGTTGTNPTTPEAKPAAPKVEPQNDGSVNVTPAADTDTLKITYTPEGEDKEKTITVTKGADNKWKKGDDTPEGVTVDETTGKVTIPADKIKDNSDVKAKDSKNGTESNENTGKTGTNPTAPETKPNAPTVTPKDDGSVEVTPATDTDTLEITYTPEGDNTTKTITVKKGTDGKWKIDGNTPEGVTVNENDGKVTIPANKIKDGSKVTAKDKNGNNTSDEATGQTGTNPSTTPETKKPAAPTITTPTSGSDQGSATITPATDTDTLEITYTPEGDNTTKTITVKKGTDGKWKIDGNTPEGVTVNENDGKVTIPADKIKDGSKVTAKDKNGNNTSDEATGQTGTNPSTTPETKKPAAPTVTPKDDGSVEVTPATDTDTLEITYTPEGENTNPTNFTVKKENGKWKKGENTPEGVTVDEGTGKVTIPADKVKDNSDVTAKNSKNGTNSDNATGQAGNNDGNSGSGTGSGTGSGSDSGNSTSNNGGSASGSTTGSSSSTDSGAQDSTNESTKSGNEAPAKHSSQLVKTGAEVERVGLISAMIAVLGAAAAFFSRKKNRE